MDDDPRRPTQHLHDRRRRHLETVDVSRRTRDRQADFFPHLPYGAPMPIAPDKLTRFRHLRRHGVSFETAARKADLTLDQAHKAEGRFYCPNCPAETGPFDGAYVHRSECPHWDYEVL